ncbi:MAG: zf-HC2 domain-containing protein [Candidatus Zixiibacteriota bacterium]|nr:MAG: zf-HC2 domain-containing protein [candidate division Zixibacteria bacterium]
MTGCTNKEMERLLHDYELDMLSADDKQQFELHLYECDHCLSLVHEFMDVSCVIRHDQDVQTIIKDISGERENSEPERVGKKPSPFTRYLIAAIIVLVIGIPAYWYWSQSQRMEILQTLELLSSRAGGNDIIYLENGGDVKISFYISENFQGEAELIISSIAGDTVLHTPGFKDFNDKGVGSIRLPVSKFTDGHYMLTIKPDPEIGLEERIYMFRVK